MTVESGAIVRGDMFYTMPGASTVMNVFYWRNFGDPGTEAAVTAAIDVWATDTWGDPWNLIADAAATLERVELKKVLANGTVVAGIGTATVSKAGGVGSTTVMPAAVSGFIQTDVLNSTLKGRKFVPGLAETMITDGIITSGAIAELIEMLDAWQTTVTTGGVELVPVLISIAANTFRIMADSGLVSDVPAYQRRRKPQVGI